MSPMHLLSRIQRYLRHTGISPSAFGREVVRDPRFVHDLRNGREPRIATERRIHAWLDAHEEIAR